MKTQKTQILFAMNRHSNVAEIMEGFACFEHLQGAFRCGIMLSDGTSANAIGRCKSRKDFTTRAACGGTRILA